MKTLLNVKVDESVKHKAQKVAKDMGLTLSAVINAYLRQLVRDQELHLSVEPTMSKELEELIGEVEEDIKTGRNISKPLSTHAELEEYLDSL